MTPGIKPAESSVGNYRTDSFGHKEELLKILGELPSYAVIEKACRMMGCKMTAESLGIREDIIEDAMKYSPYVSPDITLLR